MLNKLRKFLRTTSNAEIAEAQFDASDHQLAQAALMFHVIAADGMVYDEEKNKLRQILESRYQLSVQESEQLFEEAKRADREAIDLYSFTSILKRQLDHGERLLLVKNLWEMVFADGEIHELEDNVVWRIAELLAVDKRERMELKRDVRREMQDRP
jgi:uncharacterized tellurite resistance protein B-like protein